MGAYYQISEQILGGVKYEIQNNNLIRGYMCFYSAYNGFMFET
jgi:hypothetical protein